MVISTNEDKLKKPDGSIITRTGIVDQSIEYYKEAYQEELTNISDFSQGSEIRTLHESIAVELFQLYVEDERQARMKYVKYANGYYLDLLACEYHLERKSAEVATGSVTFQTSASIVGVINIPANTIILDVATGYEYVLDQDIYIDSSDTPVNGTVHSKLAGAKYNAPIGRLRTFKDLGAIRTEITVTNNTEIVDGKDGETDEELRTRILNAKREKAWGTAPTYSNLLINEVPDIHDVQFVDPEVLLTNEEYPRHYKEGTTLEDTYQRNSDWTIHKDSNGNPVLRTFAQLKEYLCTSCTAVLFINAFSKPCPDHVIEDAEYIMTQQNNLVVGQKFHIEKAQPNKIFLDIQIYVTATIDEDILYDHIMSYFDGGSVTAKIGDKEYSGLNIGETLFKVKLIDVLEDIPSVYQVGHIKQAKYNADLPEAIGQWDNNGELGWTYEDDEGYIYERTSSTSTASIKHWGSKNFNYIETLDGTVFQLGQKKDVDSSTDEIFNIEQIPVDQYGNIVVTLENST